MKINGLVSARGSDYGHPKEDFTRTSALWSAFLGIHIDPAQVPVMMILLKCSREKHKHKQDNIDDIQGYAETINMLYEPENKRKMGQSPKKRKI